MRHVLSNTMMPAHKLLLAALAGAGAAALVVAAGPLNPPAGPVTSTYKTLTEVEPRIAINLTNTPGDANSLFKITQPGSYYLTGNITGVASKSGIEIAANDVMLDLNGFELIGIPGATSAVITSVSAENIVVLNGTLRSWPSVTISLNTTGGRLQGLHVRNGGSIGISTGGGCTIRDCSSSGNGFTGINIGQNCTVENCTASANGGAGFSINTGSSALNCVANGNTAQGILAQDTCVITGCAANNNGSNGIAALTGPTISHCSARNNTGAGISTQFSGLVSDCVASDNVGVGISASVSCMVSGCITMFNDLDGIVVGVGSSVTTCTSRGNVNNGIVVSANALVLNNNCNLNGNAGDGAGIHATSIDNRIEGNTCTGADRGIDVGGAGNIIIKNSCSGNTIDWVIVANNVFGPIIDRRAPANAAVSGFTAASSLGSTDANANFSY